MRYIVVLFVIIFIVLLTLFVRHCADRKITIILYILYLGGVLLVTLISRNTNVDHYPRLDPFEKYQLIARRFWFHASQDGFPGICRVIIVNEAIITEILLNYLLFVPFGLLTPYISHMFKHWWKIVLLGLAFSLAIEIIQYYAHLGCFEMVDILNNTVGVVIGYGLYVKILKKNGNRVSMNANSIED